MALETRYAACRDWPVERLVESLASLLTVRRRRIARQRITFLDTVDGRVGRAEACLTSTADAGGNRIQWQQGNVRVGCTLDGMACFAWDLPQGPVRQRIEPIIEARRLLPLAEAEHEGVVLDVMDEARKTIARLEIVSGRARGPEPRSPWQPLRPFLTLKALRGYDEQCAAPIAIIESRPGIERSDCALQGHVLRTIGATFPANTVAHRAELEPLMRADIGWLRMQRELLRSVTASHAGVLADLDGECLHDLRVGVRRSRVLLAHIQGVPAQAEIDRLETELAWLGRITGPVRDLDVLLLGLRSASDDLKTERQGALVQLLEQERARAQQALAEDLTSERYRRLVDRWKTWLSQDARSDPGEWGALPLATVVAQCAWQLYQRVLCGIEQVRSDTPTRELHRIRIDVKNLSGLIDAAASLYDAGHVAAILRALKPLQSVLGDLNDACVQASWLRRFAQTLRESGCDVTSVRRAAEALADLADSRAKALRKRANEAFLRFGERANRVAFEHVFSIEQPTELVQ